MKATATAKAIPLDTTRHASGTSAKIEERIRSRAYELYEQRGKGDGCDWEDWLQAEAEMANGKA